MGVRGISNARGSQFVRAVSLTRVNGLDPTGPGIDVGADVNYVVGFTSGVPATYSSQLFTGSTTAVSGITIPAQGMYEAVAIVNVSGLSAGANLGIMQQEYGIELTLDGTLLAQSVRVYPVPSGAPLSPAGTANPAARPIVPLKTECLFEANGGAVLAVQVKSNTALGSWRLTGADTLLASRGHAYPAAAAILLLKRVPTTPLDSTTKLI